MVSKDLQKDSAGSSDYIFCAIDKLKIELEVSF